MSEESSEDEWSLPLDDLEWFPNAKQFHLSEARIAKLADETYLEG